jgi:hypothetical protein
MLRTALVLGAFVLLQTAASAQVTLSTAAVPSSGLAGTTTIHVTGSGFPSGLTAASVTMSFASSCLAVTPAGTTTATRITLLGGTDMIYGLIPGSLKTGTYAVWVTGSSPAFTSTSCATLSVTATSTTLAACVPTSSLAVTAGTDVNAYVPFGYWESSATGIEEVPLEGTGTAHNFATTGAVNSCASNSVTGEVVCTENSTNVDLIMGTTLTTVTSGSNATAGFSGGSCENCGVGINAANNTAVIAMGYYAGTGYSGVQVLNLAENSFNTPVNLSHYVSEDISIDSGRNLILSPGEGGYYDLLQIGSGNSLTEFGQYIGGELDSAAEDCTTGIGLASDEFTDDIYITDLTQAKFTSGTPGTWTGAGQFIDLGDGGYSAGTCGISVAPGTGHMGVVTGEFGGSSFAALQLPSSSGSGTPTLADYAYVDSMPSTPDGIPFSAGYDPHTVTAYTSPNTNKSYAVFADYAYGYPTYLGVVDLGCVLALPRTGVGSHIVSGSAASCVRYVAVP